MIKGLIFFSLMAPAFVLAQGAVEVENKSYWMCRYRKEVRTIRVHVDSEGMCSTFYSKFGSEKMIGSGRHLESCNKFLENVRTNLEKSNWACKDITNTRMTASTPAEKPRE